MQRKIFGNRLYSILIAAIVCTLWGSLFPFIQVGYNVFGIVSTDMASIIMFAGIRFTLCGMVLIMYVCLKNGRFISPDKGSSLPIITVGLTNIILHYSLTYIGLSLCPGGKSAILKQIGYLFIACFAFLFRKEDRFTFSKLIGGILGFCSIIAINMDGLDFKFALGDVIIILASFCSVAANVISKDAYDKYEPLTIVAYSQLFGGMVLLASGILCGGKFTIVSFQSVAVITYICAASIVAYSLWNILVKYNDLSRLSVIKFMEPIFAVVFSAMLTGENIFKPSYVIAVICIAVSVVIVNISHKNKK